MPALGLLFILFGAHFNMPHGRREKEFMDRYPPHLACMAFGLRQFGFPWDDGRSRDPVMEHPSLSSFMAAGAAHMGAEVQLGRLSFMACW
jgi:hypothetical protein